jgi:hypothetical protein
MSGQAGIELARTRRSAGDSSDLRTLGSTAGSSEPASRKGAPDLHKQWGGEDSNLRPADYESYGPRVAPSIWCALVPSSPGHDPLMGPFVLFRVVLCVPVR